MRLALDDAGVTPDEVDLDLRARHRHPGQRRHRGHGHPRGLRRGTPRTISIKSMLGHTMGAASALGAIACALAIDGSFIPPTINHRSTGPGVRDRLRAQRARPTRLRVVQNNGLAFGGNNAIVLLAHPERDGA